MITCLDAARLMFICLITGLWSFILLNLTTRPTIVIWLVSILVLSVLGSIVMAFVTPISCLW